MIRRLASTFVLALLLASTLATCGGGGGGGGGPTVPPPPARMISWSPEADPGADTIYLDVRDLSNPDTFVLQIRVRRVSDLYGVALDVVYPSTRMTFDSSSVTEGDFLGGGGGFDTELEVSEPTPGRIIIGNTRLGDVRGRSTSGLLLSLTFNTTANGPSDITIDRELALDSDGFELPMTWLGGTVQVQR